MKKKEYHTWIKLNVLHDTIVTRSDEVLALETLAFESLYGIHIINSVDKTKFSCNTPTDAAPQFL